MTTQSTTTGAASPEIFEAKWAVGYDHLKAYYLEHSVSVVPRNYKSPDGYQLGYWTHAQRHSKKTSESPHRIRLLDEIGFEWRPHEESWNRGVAEFRSYVEEFGDPMVPNLYIAPSGFRLGEWISGTRTQRRKGNTSALRILELDSLGFCWAAGSVRRKAGIEEFKKYVAEFGSPLVPTIYIAPSGFDLGIWVRRIRTKYRHGEDKPSELEAIGFSWSGRSTDKWDAGIIEFKLFVIENHRHDVPTFYVSEGGFELGKWVAAQRQYRKRGTMGEDQIKALDDLGFLWRVYSSKQNPITHIEGATK